MVLALALAAIAMVATAAVLGSHRVVAGAVLMALALACALAASVIDSARRRRVH